MVLETEKEDRRQKERRIDPDDPMQDEILEARGRHDAGHQIARQGEEQTDADGTEPAGDSSASPSAPLHDLEIDGGMVENDHGGRDKSQPLQADRPIAR